MSGTISALLDIIVPGNTSLMAIELEGCFFADGSVSKQNSIKLEVRHLKQQLFKRIWGKCLSICQFFATHILGSRSE